MKYFFSLHCLLVHAVLSTDSQTSQFDDDGGLEAVSAALILEAQ